MITIAAILRYFGSDGRMIGDHHVGLESLNDLPSALDVRPHGTVRITVDLALPLTYPCQWIKKRSRTEHHVLCGEPSVTTREISRVVGKLHDRPQCSPWQSLDLCFAHYSEAQTHQAHGTLLMRQPDVPLDAPTP